MTKIPPSIIGVAAPILAEQYSHSQLDALFMACGFPGDPPGGNKVDKCRIWLRSSNNELADPLEKFGRLIAELMDAESKIISSASWITPQGSEREKEEPQEKIKAALAREGMSYQRGGIILGAALSGPSRSLAEYLQKDGILAVEREYARAYSQIESDPHAAVTAGCAILESICKVYLEKNQLPFPNKQILSALWSDVARNIGLSPKEVADDDLKRILSGLFSIAEGVAALRTHEGSAHGHSDKKLYKLETRHARLAVHSAHTMALFILETWKARQ